MALFSFTFFGVPVVVEWWVIPLIFLLGLHAKTYLEKVYSQAKYQPGYWVVLSILAVAAFLSIVAHEVCHGVVAYYLGHPLSEARFSFLYASVSPVEDLETISYRDMFFIALAGPMANLFLGLVAAVFVKRLPETFLENSIQHFSYINVFTGRINLFPIMINGFALDGGFVLYCLLGLTGLSAEVIRWTMVVITSLFFNWYIFRIQLHGRGIKRWTNWENHLAKL